MQAAAVEMGVGMSVLKRVCRGLGLARWPFRLRQSLRAVISQTELYMVSQYRFCTVLPHQPDLGTIVALMQAGCIAGALQSGHHSRSIASEGF